MTVSRRDFLKYCAASAGALGLSAMDLSRLEAALANAATPTILWLHGSGCQGDSVSFLNLIRPDWPAGQRTVDDILVNSVNLAYHTVVMSGAGDPAVAMLQQARRKGGYILVLEGGIPTAFSGQACVVYAVNGKGVTYQAAVQDLAAGAAAIVCVGTCSSFGGIPRSGPNITQVVSGKEATGKSVINIPGCPAHPEWIAWAVVQLLLGNSPTLDADSRPTALYGNKAVDADMLNVHSDPTHGCPRRETLPTHKGFATIFGQDGYCLQDLGCRGPSTYATCPLTKWNNAANWCVDSNGMCIGCVENGFPGGPFYT
ncbi:MAG: hydrogenase small subunit [Candidatus Sumerlaeota bacterium]|nr:hydrogenase small subunit [Candidatus Sumerlaeota bacterium]